MDYVSQRVDRSKIKAGDHIYTYRTAFTYSHHGIYIGRNKVIHFTRPENDTSDSVWNFCSGFPSLNPNLCTPSLNTLSCEFPLSKSDENCNLSSCLDLNPHGPCLTNHVCGFHQPGSGVLLSCVNCFIGNGSLYLYEYGLSKSRFIFKIRGGTCTTANSDPPEDVIHRAEYLLQHGFGSYDVTWNNCEDFALYCKTGLLVDTKAAKAKGTTGGSGQVNFMASTINDSMRVVASLAVDKILCSSSGPVGAVSVAVVMSCYNRYKTDIGVRDDVVKLNVEDFEFFQRR